MANPGRLLRLADDMAGRAAEDEGFAAVAVLAAHAVLESLVNQLGREEIQSFNQRARFLPKWHDLCERTLGDNSTPRRTWSDCMRSGTGRRLQRAIGAAPAVRRPLHRRCPRCSRSRRDVGRSTRLAGWSRSFINAQVVSAPTGWTGWHETRGDPLR